MQLYFSGESLRNVQKFIRLQGPNVSRYEVNRAVTRKSFKFLRVTAHYCMANIVVEEATQDSPLRVCELKFPIQAMTQIAVTYLRAPPRQQRCRDIIDALASILKAVADQKNQASYRQTTKRGEYGGALVTRIKNQARVTSRQLKRYLKMLSTHGLIKMQYKLRKNVVRLTDKGSEYLQMYRKIYDLLLF